MHHSNVVFILSVIYLFKSTPGNFTEYGCILIRCAAWSHGSRWYRFFSALHCC